MNQNASSSPGSDKGKDSPSSSGRPSPQLDTADPTATASPTVASAKSSVDSKEGSLEGTSTCDGTFLITVFNLVKLHINFFLKSVKVSLNKTVLSYLLFLLSIFFCF